MAYHRHPVMTSHLPARKPGSIVKAGTAPRGTSLRFSGNHIAKGGSRWRTAVLLGGLDQSIRIEMFGDLHEVGALGRAVTRSEALKAI
jgi:hypothetical protein